MSLSKIVFLELDEYLRLKGCEEKMHKLIAEKKPTVSSPAAMPSNEKDSGNKEDAGEAMEGEGAASFGTITVGAVPMPTPLAAELTTPIPQPPPEIPIMQKDQQPEFSEEIRQDKSWKPFLKEKACSSKMVDEEEPSTSKLVGKETPWYFLGLDFDSEDE
jgi:hypothetical protein